MAWYCDFLDASLTDMTYSSTADEIDIELFPILCVLTFELRRLEGVMPYHISDMVGSASRMLSIFRRENLPLDVVGETILKLLKIASFVYSTIDNNLEFLDGIYELFFLYLNTIDKDKDLKKGMRKFLKVVRCSSLSFYYEHLNTLEMCLMPFCDKSSYPILQAHTKLQKILTRQQNHSTPIRVKWLIKCLSYIGFDTFEEFNDAEEFYRFTRFLRMLNWWPNREYPNANMLLISFLHNVSQAHSREMVTMLPCLEEFLRGVNHDELLDDDNEINEECFVSALRKCALILMNINANEQLYKVTIPAWTLIIECAQNHSDAIAFDAAQCLEKCIKEENRELFLDYDNDYTRRL